MHPRERLWRRLGAYFAPHDEFVHATPDVELSQLTPPELERIWKRLSDSADIDPSHTVWDDVDEADVPAVHLLSKGPVEAAARCKSLLVPLIGVSVGDVRLPFLGLYIYPDAIGLYWWVNRDPWDAGTVAAFADLLGELFRIAPEAARSEEDGAYGGDFWPAVEEYLSAQN